MNRKEFTFPKEVLFRNAPGNNYPGKVFRAIGVEQQARGQVVLIGYCNASKSCREQYGMGVVEHEATSPTVLADAGVDMALWQQYETDRIAQAEQYKLERAQREKERAAAELLRSAAPDLLKALQDAVAMINSLNSAYGSEEVDAVANAGTLAINKATGAAI